MFVLGEQETLRKNPRIWVLLLAILTMQAAGCITIKRRTEVKKEEIRPQLESSEENLLASYNNQVRSVQSLQATVDLIPSTGTTYSGVIEEYHDVPGFILAQRPATVRVIGQAPVVAKNIFDMVSDGKEFRIYIPSKNSFLVGPTALIRPSKKPLENLRPQHIVEALFWPELSAGENVLFEQFDFSVSRYYILTLLRQSGGRKIRNRQKNLVQPHRPESLPRPTVWSGRQTRFRHPVFGLGTMCLRPKAPPRRNRRVSRATSTSGAPRTITNSRSRF